MKTVQSSRSRFLGTLMAALISLMFVSVSSAELKDENLLQGMPDGYKIGAQNRQGKNQVIEMVPNAETVDNWTEMLTTQITFGNLPTTPDGFRQTMENLWKKSCPNATGKTIASGKTNGYDFTTWSLSCPLNPATGKPEYTWLKAIKGKDSFYNVQKAWKKNPTKQELDKWLTYLDKVSVCDSRVAAQACPKTGK